MTLTELQNSIRELGGQIRTAASALAAAAANPATPADTLTQQRDALTAMNARMAAMQSAYNAQYENEVGGLPGSDDAHARQEQERGLHDMLGSREYARAFASAIRTGTRPNRPMTDETHKVLYDALTIGGGSTPGEDGGFLVPEDIDHAIRERRRSLSPLSELFTVETTSANSGWRVMDKAPTKGMTALTSEIPAGGIPTDDQPEFVKVPYSLTTYSLILPVSNELASDEVANMFGYVSKWFSRKHVITENLLLKTALEKLPAIALNAADPLAALKSILNKSFDPEIGQNAVILTNQDGFDLLDQMKDSTGRPMLQPDPTSPTNSLFKGRRVKMVANSLLPSTGDVAPLYVGDFTQYATLFIRQHLELASTDIGGNAFRTNSIEVRGISRMGVSMFDTEAAVRRTLSAAAPASDPASDPAKV